MATRIRELQNTFQAGQIDARAIGRHDITLFEQALKNGENWRIISSGGLERRPGTKYLANAGQDGRLIPFEFDDTQLFIFMAVVGGVHIYDYLGNYITLLVDSDITSDIAWEMSWAQSGDFMFLCHKDMVTKEIQRTGTSTFAISDYAFDLDDNAISQNVFTKYADVSNTITITNPVPYRLTSSANHFEAAHATIGAQVKVWASDGGTPAVFSWYTFQITNFVSATQVDATLLSPAAPSLPHTATKQWLEEAINSIHGWPQAVAFHAGRLWFGGLKLLPSHLMASKIGLFWNFDVENATDDDAIFAPIDSDRINEVRHLVSGKHLQIFSDLSEMHISEEEGSPITPSRISLRTSSRYGSCFLRPLVFDDATLFVQHGRKVVREYAWNSLNVGYTSNPLSLLSNDLITEVRQTAIDYGGEGGPEQYAYFINTDGSMAVYHAIRSEQINGFFPWSTEGEFKSITVVGDVLYALVKRVINGANNFWLERFDRTIHLDGGIEATAGTPTDTFSGFTEYANQNVHVTSENNQYYLGEYTIDGSGNLDISANGFTASQVWVGLNYVATAETLPVNFGITTGDTTQLPKRIISGIVRADSAYEFTLEGKIFYSRLISHDVSLPPQRFTGIRRSFMLGAAFDKTLTVVSNIPLDCTILSMGMEVGL